MLLIRIAGGVVLVALLLAFLLRGRFGTRAGSSPKKSRVDPRPTLPPSPYQPSRGFRILDGNESVDPPAVQLPRLDPKSEFVFSDPLAAPVEAITPPHLRHDEQWALDRSMRHTPPLRVRRRRRLTTGLLVLVMVSAVVAGLWLRADSHHAPTHGLHHLGPIVTSIRTF